jgi:hypothetical protein
MTLESPPRADEAPVHYLLQELEHSRGGFPRVDRIMMRSNITSSPDRGNDPTIHCVLTQAKAIQRAARYLPIGRVVRSLSDVLLAVPGAKEI